MGLKPGYKQTEVGVIPEAWEIKELKEFATVRGGKRLPLGHALTDTRTNHPYIRVVDMRPGGVDLSGIKYVPDDTFPAIKNYRIFTKDLFISVAGTLGVVGKVPPELDGANLTENADKITDISCDQNFLLHNLLSERIQRSIEAERTLGAQPKLALGRIEKFRIALPPTSTEQRAIAEALNDVDALIGALDQLIAKKRDLKQAAMQQLLTGQKRLPGFSREWGVKRLGDIAMLYQPITISARQFTESGFPVYGANGVVGFYNEFNHETWQVTVTCRGSTCGTVNRTVEKCWITGNAMVVNCDHSENLNKDFLYYALLRQDLSVCITGSGQPQIVRAPLTSIELEIPSELAEQTAIAEVLSDMDAEIAALERRRDKTRALKQGMMQELLTGRTRLVR